MDAFNYFCQSIVINGKNINKNQTIMGKNYLKQLIVAALLLCSTLTNAQNFEYEGIYYNITDETNRTVEVIAGDNVYSGKVTIPSSVPYYGNRYTVTAVGGGAFHGCTGLESITIPNSVITVGVGAFCNCTGLKEVYLEDGTQELHLAQSRYGANGGMYFVHGVFYYSPLEKVYLGRDVTYPDPESFPTAPFQDKSTLKSVTIGDKVTKLGTKLFYYCKNIEGELIVPDNVVTIGKNAFYCCQNITGLKLGKNVTTIETDAFFQCSALTGTLAIPGSVRSINGGAFNGCNFTGVNVDNLSDWCRISFANIQANPLHCAGKLYVNDGIVTDLVVPDDITEIKPYAFYNCTSLSSVEFGNNLQTIDDSAFKYCTGLTNITVPGNVKDIGGSAFAYCTNLESITLNEGTVSIGGNAFNNCKKIKSMTIPNTVTNLGVGVFSYCYALENVVIGDGVTEIPSDSFYLCTPLNTLTIGKNVKKIGGLGYDVKWLRTIHISDLSAWCKISFSAAPLADGGSLYLNGERITELVIPDDVTEIKPYAFYNCDAITSVTMHDNVTSIGENAFRECYSLSKLENGDNVTSIGNGAFYRCVNLNELGILDNVASIGDYAFYECYSLKKMKIGDNVTSIGDYTFYRCVNLNELEIGENVTSIGYYAFRYCSGLSELKIGNNVTSIGRYAFLDCSNLKKIEIGENVTSIGESAFDGCSGLTDITSYIPAEKLFVPGYRAFGYSVNSNCILYVPKGAKEKYASTDRWNMFTNIIEMRKSFDLAVTAAEHATLFLDFDTDIPEGVEVYTANGTDGNCLKMQQVTGVLPANTGVMVKAPAGTYTFTESDSTANAIEDNLLLGSVEDTIITPGEDTKCYVLSMQDGIVGMYGVALSDGSFKNNANKAYLALGTDAGDGAETPGVERSNGYYFDFSGITAIDAVQTEDNDNVYYDLSGRVVENPACGIYILNGKKVLVK